MSLDVHAGELFGFVGRNGAGKTTTMRIVLGVLAPDADEVRWDGRPLDLAARRWIGYMSEERGLYPKMRLSGWSLKLKETACVLADANSTADFEHGRSP